MSEEPKEASVHIHTEGGAYIAGNVDTGGGDFVGRDKYEIHMPVSRKDARERRDQLILLEKVRKFWVEGVLEKSLHQAVLIELGKESRPDLISHPWETVVELPDQKPTTLLSGKSVANIFDEAGRSLLILGEPGSGKTITMLELARDLLNRAEKNQNEPIPVVLNLSTWGERRLSFAEWVVEELSKKYQIPKKIGRKWLENHDLLLLLDGLDEVRRETQSACANSINQFGLEIGLSGIVVCSRIAEYQLLETKLSMGGAVYIQPLNKEQVNTYLDKIGEPLAGLRQSLEHDSTLQELAQTPLMLSVMGFAYKDLPSSALGRDALPLEARRKHIFNTYIRRMFARAAGKKLFPIDKTIGWLSWLAKNLRSQNLTVFLIESLQPNWFDHKLYMWCYVLLSRTCGGLLLGLGEFIGGSTDSIFVFILPSLGIAGGLITGILTAWLFTQESLGGAILVNQPWWRRLPIVGLSVGVLLGAVSAAAGFLNRFFTTFKFYPTDEQPFYRLLGSLGAGILSGIMLAISVGCLSGIVFELVFGRRLRWQSIREDIHTTEALRWSWRLALKSAPRGAFFGAILGPILSIPMGISISDDMIDAIVSIPVSCLVIGVIGTVGGLIVGLVFGGLRGVEIPQKTMPNQGIWLSVKSSFIIGGGITFLFGLLFNVITLPAPDSIGDWIDNFKIGLSYGLAAIMFVGILDFIQHFVLRLILLANGRIPLHLSRFLDYADTLIFLRKVGGGYIFIHRLIQEHFAELDVKAFKMESHG